jgi:hypothetical protein
MSNLDSIDANALNTALCKLARERGLDPRRLLHSDRLELLAEVERNPPPPRVGPEPKPAEVPRHYVKTSQRGSEGGLPGGLRS